MKGILVGADRKIEWLLDFWWSNYQKHNCFPVTFVDFGMSAKAKEWCEKRGSVISVEMPVKVCRKSKVEPTLAKKWEEIYGKQIWKQRQSWFKKPFALLLSPYETTIWLDLDCEVLGPLMPLFEECASVELAMAKETEAAHQHEREKGQLFEYETLYNSGVIVYQKEALLIKLWARSVEELNGQFWGDQQLLSRLIYLNRLKVGELAPEYNWRMSQGVNFHAVIVHWVSQWGKEYIRKYGGFSKELTNLFETK